MAKSTSANVVRHLRNLLRSAKGTWPRIARVSRVPYGTIEKIAQGDTKSPSLLTVERLLAYFGERIDIRPLQASA